MPTKLKSRCPHCHATLKVKESQVGKHARCPACNQKFLVDSVEAAGASASLDQARPATETINAASSDTSGEPDLYPPRHNHGKSPAPLLGEGHHSLGAGLPTPPAPLGSLGRFELKELLGQGAFGRVYRAYDPQLDREVALKVPVFGSEDRHLIERFITEAKSAARLRHANIVTIHDIGQIEGRPYIVAHFVRGQSLSKRIEESPPSFREAAQWVCQLADALAYAHSEGVIHRDIKPANIMLDAKGVPQIMDFGLAKRLQDDSRRTADGSILGTPAYMSPEQARGDLNNVGPLSDQYSLGVVLYELLTSKRPFEGPSYSVIAQVCTIEPPAPHSLRADIPKELETICQRAMSKDPSKRYASATEMAQALAFWLSTPELRFVPSKPAPRRPSLIVRGVRWCHRNALVASILATILILLTFGLSTTSTLVSIFAKRTPALIGGAISDADVFTSLFNGKDLTGWTGDTNIWSVEDGAIIARKPPGILSSSNAYLIWEGGQPADFDLRCKYRIGAGSDAGIQYRSRVVQGTAGLGGYQADIDTRSTYLSSGACWEENGRAFLAMRGQRVTIRTPGVKEVEQFSDKDWLQGKISNDDWNEYRIVAQGNRLQHYINGALMSEVIDTDTSRAATSGIIALQFTPLSDKPVQFKDVRLKILSERDPGPGTALIGKELLVNPGCEDGLIDGRTPGWLTIRGDWRPGKGAEPIDGNWHFRSTSTPNAELQQDVNIQAVADVTTAVDLKYSFVGYVQSYKQNPRDIDKARIIIECRDRANQQVLDTFDSGEIAHVNDWKSVTARRTLPIGTAIIRVRLIARLIGQERGTKSNDAWFDGLSLRLAVD